MGCGESKHAVATDNSIITQVKPSIAEPEISNAPQVENNDIVEAIVGENGELPSQDDGNKNEDAVVAEDREELKEKNADNQEAITEKTSTNGDVVAATEEPKQEDKINQNNEENIPNAEEIVGEASKEDSKTN